MILYTFLLILGLGLLIVGAELFVKGSAAFARVLRISPLIIGLTIVAIGTSLPELFVSVLSSSKGMNDMSLGNIIGSNIFDVLVALGLPILIGGITIKSDMKSYDIPIAINITLITILFSFVITPKVIGRVEALILLLLFAGYMAFLILRGGKEKEEKKCHSKWYLCVILMLIGIVGLILGSELVVKYASLIGKELGMSEMLISLTIVAVGTSLPELAAGIMSVLNKEYSIAVGNAIGSCIFNILLILGLSGLVSPIKISSGLLPDFIILVLSITILYVISLFRRKIPRIVGVIFILMYIFYIIYLIK